MHMYTNDPVFIAVGPVAALALLTAFLEETEEIGLVLAGPEKAQMGGHVEWIGVAVMAALFLLVVPKNKLLRAKAATADAKSGLLPFSEYRALVGLLEHLRFVAQIGPSKTAPLYHPHRRKPELEPAELVIPTPEMVEALDEWLLIIDTCGGTVTTVAFYAAASERLRSAQLIVAASADAAMDGEGEPGIGGYVHGVYWRVPISLTLLAVFHITAWEFFASILTVFVAARISGAKALIAQQSDALLTAYTMSTEKSSSEDIRHVVALLVRDTKYDKDIALRLVVEHFGGLGNFAADRVSRNLMHDLNALAEVLHVRLRREALDAHELHFLAAAIRAKAERLRIDVEEELCLIAAEQALNPQLHEPTRDQPMAFDGRGMENIPLAMDSDNGILPGPTAPLRLRGAGRTGTNVQGRVSERLRRLE